MRDYSTINSFDNTVSRILTGVSASTVLRLIPTGQRVICITDRTVALLHPKLVDNFETIVIEPGESSKSFAVVEQIIAQLIEKRADRGTFLLGVGGGVVTDITGFTASIFMRGVDFGFVATTLLAQVDAAIGGKNGVDVGGFKNMAGVFRQPKFVVCDSDILRTLPDREFRAGMAEVIKAAVIGDRMLMKMCNLIGVRPEGEQLDEIISRAVAVKSQIVQADERESGARKLLNLGHTFAHAIEKCDSRVGHGEAVAIGLCMASDISVKLGLCTPQVRDEIHDAVRRNSLPLISGVGSEQLLEVMKTDKKHSGESVDLILPKTIGQCVIEPVSFAVLERLLNDDF